MPSVRFVGMNCNSFCAPGCPARTWSASARPVHYLPGLRPRPARVVCWVARSSELRFKWNTTAFAQYASAVRPPGSPEPSCLLSSASDALASRHRHVAHSLLVARFVDKDKSVDAVVLPHRRSCPAWRRSQTLLVRSGVRPRHDRTWSASEHRAGLRGLPVADRENPLRFLPGRTCTLGAPYPCPIHPADET